MHRDGGPKAGSNRSSGKRCPLPKPIQGAGQSCSPSCWPGEPLQGEREPLGILALERQKIGERNFRTQYLQDPFPPDGGMIRPSWFQRYDEPPQYEYGDRCIFSWDTAMGGGDGADYSVCTSWLIRDGRYYLLDVIRKRLLYPELRRTIARQFHIRPETNKVHRASIASGQIEAGNVYIPRHAATPDIFMISEGEVRPMRTLVSALRAQTVTGFGVS